MKIKFFILLMIFINCIYLAFAGTTEISTCRDLDVTDENYVLTANVSSEGTCFNVLANGVTLDCRGYEINYSYLDTMTGYGTNITGYNFTTVKNCRIIGGLKNYVYNNAIMIKKAKNSTILNNTLSILLGSGSCVKLEFSEQNSILNNTLFQSPGYGIDLTSSSNNFLENNNILTYGASDFGISIVSSNSNLINNNSVTTIGGEAEGIRIQSSNLNILSNNTISTSDSAGYPIRAVQSSYTNLSTNIINSSAYYGFYSDSSSNCTLTGNRINTSKGISYYIYGTNSDHYNHSIDATNFAEGGLVNYTINAENLIFDGANLTQYGQVIFINSKNIRILNSNFSGDSLSLFNTNLSAIINNTIDTSTGSGIYLSSSSINNIENNTIRVSGAYLDGIYLSASSNCNISNNLINVSGAQAYTIYSTLSSNNLINSNIINSGTGIYLSSSNYNVVENNTIKVTNARGYGLYLYASIRCNISNNRITGTGGDISRSVFLYSASNYNNLISNIINSTNSPGIVLNTNVHSNNISHNNITVSLEEGISLSANTSNNIFTNNLINVFGISTKGISLSVDSNNNSFSGMNVFTNNSNTPGILIYYGNHNFTFFNSKINSSFSGVSEINITSTNVGGTWNFTNVTRADGISPININWDAGGNGTLNMNWYADFYTNYSNSSIAPGYNISTWDVNYNFINSTATNDSGNARITLLEYRRNETSGTNYTYYSNYSFNASTWYYPVRKSANLSGNKEIVFTLDVSYPNATLLTPSNASYLNSSAVNLTANLSDEFGGIKNATVWVYNESGLYSSTDVIDYVQETFTSTLGVVITFVEGIYKWFYGVFDFTDRQFVTGNYTLTIDLTYPNVSFIDNTPANYTGLASSSFGINVSIQDTYLANITYTWNGQRIYYNASNLTNLGGGSYLFNITQSGLSADTIYKYNVTAYDTAGNKNVTEMRYIYYDTIAPFVANGSGMPVNNGIGGSETFFNWTVSDNLDLELQCYPNVDSAWQGVYQRNVTNGTKSNVTFSLSGGLHVFNITCIDDANNTNQSMGISYLVAVVNISSPTAGQIIRQNELFGFIVKEIEGVDFLNNVTIDIYNATLLANLTTVGDPDHINVYTFPTWNPVYLTILATGFNNSMGVTSNTTNSRRIVFLRQSGNTSAPILKGACPNVTYVINGTSVSLDSIADLDTLISSQNLTITDPGGLVHNLTYNSNLTDSSGYLNYYNFSFFVNKTGTYNISASVTDYESQQSPWGYQFYSDNNTKNIRINSTISNLSLVAQCTERTLQNGTDLDMKLTHPGLIYLNVTIDEILKDIFVYIKDVNLTSNISEVLPYISLSSEVSAPTNQRRVFLFQMNSTFNFSNYTLTLDYTPMESTLTNESKLRIYKCSDLSSCTLAQVDSTLSISVNKISTTLTSFGVFMITEDSTGTTPTPPTETPSSGGGGGGGGTTVVYKNFNIITPGAVDLGLKDELIVPITFNNSEDITLSLITINATSNTKDITPIFETKNIGTLVPGQYKTVKLTLQSHSTPGTYEIEITAEVGSPKITEKTKMFVRLVEGLQTKEVIEKIAISQDLFRENPQCLELNDLLIEAQRRLDIGEFQKADELVQRAINECRSLITSKEAPYLFVRIREWKTPIMVSLMALIFALFILIILMNRRNYRNLKTIEITYKSPFETVQHYENKPEVKQQPSFEPQTKSFKKDIWSED